MKSMDSGVAATEKALADFDAFIARGLDRAWTDMEKAGRAAASRYSGKTKPVTSGKPKKAASPKKSARKPAKS